MNGVSCMISPKQVITGWLRKVREVYLETADHTQTFVEVSSSLIHSADITVEHKNAAVIRGRTNFTLEITEQVSASFLQTLLGMIGNDQWWLRVPKSISGDWIYEFTQRDWCRIPHTINDLSIRFDGIPWWDGTILRQIFFCFSWAHIHKSKRIKCSQLLFLAREMKWNACVL